MAELAASAVTSLLGILSNEVQLLGRIGKDMRFIKEEMESMNSFLEHLARTTPPGGMHNEQVRTWMKQVQDLANECSLCIYLQRRDPAIHRARSGLRRYTWWSYWLVQKFLAQHSTAIRLRELKERARDISDRRFRYGVQLPAGTSAEAASGMLMARQDEEGYDDDEDDNNDGYDEDDDVHNQMTVVADSSDARRRRALEPCTMEDYLSKKLADWLELQARTEMEGGISSISIVVPDAESGSAVAREAMGLAKAHCFEKSVWINLPEVHYPWDLPLLTREILSYILQECKEDSRSHYEHKSEVFLDMWRKIDAIDFSDKIEKIRAKVEEVKKMVIEDETKSNTEEEKSKNSVSYEEPLGVVLQALRLNAEWPLTNPEKEQLSSSETIIEEMAEMLKSHIEDIDGERPPIRLHVTQYQDILRKVYLDPVSSKKQQDAGSSAAAAAASGTPALSPNHKTITLEIKREQQANSDAKDRTKESEPGDEIPSEKTTRLKIKGPGNTITLDFIGEQEQSQLQGIYSGPKTPANRNAAAIKEAVESLPRIMQLIQKQLLLKGIVDEINEHLQGKKTLIILQDDKDYVSLYWEETRKALVLLGDPDTAGSSIAVIIITTQDHKAKEYCYPQGEPITYSIVGRYHDIVIQLTSLQQVPAENEDVSNISKILRGILDKCYPHELCMKMFAHAFYANPKRSKDQLRRLHDALHDSNKLSLATNAKKIFKFSYRGLSTEHRTCLLYLAIFPQGHEIERSVLTGRWLAEGLIAKRDWPTSVRHAERCFDSLINQWLLWPADIGAAGKVKSCMLGDLIHGFIRKAAKKQHILDARLSHFLARHFSIFSGLRLRASDSIDNFVKKLPTYSPQLPFLKLLDLQGCHCLDKNHRYLKDICNKILLVKYLSLRGTGITHLPSEINNLHELEVLDIRQTRVPERDTRNIVLLKLRRLLAGHVDPDTSNHDKLVRDNDSFSYVGIPHKIEKMENMEVLSKVKASKKGSELKDIRKLWQLRKLDVVVDDNEDHLRNFLRAISDLKDCLQSLSITLPETTSQNADLKKIISGDIYHRLIQPSKLLESLSINGFTNRIRLLPMLARGSNELAKVTLSRTLLKEKNLAILAKLPNLRCIRLRHNAYDSKVLTFEENDYMNLKYFIVEGANTSDTGKGMTQTDIKFEDEAAPELEKIVLSFSNIRSICGIGRLQKLKELELKCNKFLSFSPDDAEAHKESSDSGSPNQNTQEGAPQQNTQNRDVEQNTQNTAAVQNTQNRAMAQSTENGAVVENTQSKTTTVTSFIFKVKEFEHLKYFLLAEDSKVTNIRFEEGAAPKLEKMVLSLTNESEIAGVRNLSKLKEIELKGGKFLLSSLLKGDQIAKVTLSDTQIKTDDLKYLATKTSLRCLVLSKKSLDGEQISLDKHEFPKLELLIVDCSNINSFSFADGSAPNLEKIVWSFTKMESLSGIEHLPKLQELELNGEVDPHQMDKIITAHKGRPVITHKKTRQKDRDKGSIPEEDDERVFLLSSCF
jgi:hypothetical protein